MPSEDNTAFGPQSHGKQSRQDRIRDNQRRSRQRKRQRIEDLEARVRDYERLGVTAAQEMQLAARKVINENKKLRSLLHRQGIDEAMIDAYMDDPSVHNYMVAAAPNVRTLEALMLPRRLPCHGPPSPPVDGSAREESLPTSPAAAAAWAVSQNYPPVRRLAVSDTASDSVHQHHHHHNHQPSAYNVSYGFQRMSISGGGGGGGGGGNNNNGGGGGGGGSGGSSAYDITGMDNAYVVGFTQATYPSSSGETVSQVLAAQAYDAVGDVRMGAAELPYEPDGRRRRGYSSMYKRTAS